MRKDDGYGKIDELRKNLFCRHISRYHMTDKEQKVAILNNNRFGTYEEPFYHQIIGTNKKNDVK